jgi:hypothetical protein
LFGPSKCASFIFQRGHETLLMSYDCRVYRILVASPSDVADEREVIVRLIQEWNDLHSYTKKVALLPLRWETHAAPDYATRPQEVINRAIVDECDLLVGVFWTRIGSLTGIADSGTLEEIERVGKAGKPIRLYFSNVGIEPDKIDSVQYDNLKLFKRQTYPKGLVENYNKPFEFRDKFARQLEIKIRELHNVEMKGIVPLSLDLITFEDDHKFVRELTHTIDFINVINYEIVQEDKREKLKKIASLIIKEGSYFPVALTLQNIEQVGIRNVYVQLTIIPSHDQIQLSSTPKTTIPVSNKPLSSVWHSLTLWRHEQDSLNTGASETVAKVKNKLSIFETDKLHKTDGKWEMTLEWDALQSQRRRLIEPVIYIYSPKNGKVDFIATVYSDSFTEPVKLEVSVEIKTKKSRCRHSNTNS